MILNTDRYSPTTTLRKNGVVVHTSEGSEGLLPWGQQASAQLVGFLAAKGDRPSPSRPGGFFGAGYHAVACEDGTFIEVADATAGPYSAPPCNGTWWHLCIPGRAAQTRDQWLNDVSRQYIRAGAAFIVDRQRLDGLWWPLAFRSAPDLVAAKADLAGHPAGYTSHAQVSQAWHKSDHTDPGVSFPWDILAADIALLIEPTPTPPEPPPEDDMANIGVIRPTDAGAEFIAEYVGPISGPRILKLYWLNTAEKVASAKAHVQAGATVFGHFEGMQPTPGAASLVKANLKNCYVDILPTGDVVQWSAADVMGIG